MTDFNTLLESFADLVAERVTSKLQGQDWPAIETKEVVVETKEIAPEPAKIGLANSSRDNRKAELQKTDVRTLRKRFAEVNGKDVEAYASASKSLLVEDILALETVLGRTIDEELDRLQAENIPDDNDLDEDVEDDDDPVELTRDAALELDLSELKAIAIANDVPDEELEGLDVEAVVDLLFGEEDLTPEDVKGMSISELKDLASQLNDDGAEIVFDRNTKREALIAKIFTTLDWA